jgi:subtilisin family serine protease
MIGRGNNLVASRDEHGHGTHVAGIAAGKSSKFPGIATKAKLVIVKTSFQDAHIADGIRYVFRVASELGQPAVVNPSLGGHFDAHDGTDSLSQVIDDECGSGRIVCCAAGNEGNDSIHARILLGAPATRRFRFFIPENSVSASESPSR